MRADGRETPIWEATGMLGTSKKKEGLSLLAGFWDTSGGAAEGGSVLASWGLAVAC